MIDINFASKQLQKQFSEEKAMLKAFGQQRAKRIKAVMTALRAAPNLGVFAPPFSPPHRCHELKGKRKGTLSLDLDGPYRLIVQPLNNPLPERSEGGLDWHRITAIKISGIEDTHG